MQWATAAKQNRLQTLHKLLISSFKKKNKKEREIKEKSHTLERRQNSVTRPHVRHKCLFVQIVLVVLCVHIFIPPPSSSMLVNSSPICANQCNVDVANSICCADWERKEDVNKTEKKDAIISMYIFCCFLSFVMHCTHHDQDTIHKKKQNKT